MKSYVKKNSVKIAGVVLAFVAIILGLMSTFGTPLSELVVLAGAAYAIYGTCELIVPVRESALEREEKELQEMR